MSSPAQPSVQRGVRGALARLTARPALLALLLALLGGTLSGEAAWWAMLSTHAASIPSGWTLEAPRVPYQLTDLAGSGKHQQGSWSMAYWQGFRPDRQTQRSGEQSLRLSFDLPPGGQLEIPISSGGGQDTATLILERVGAPSAKVLARRGGVQQQLPCSDQLQAPGDGPLELEIIPTSLGLRVRQGDTETPCRLNFMQPWDPSVRPGLARIHVSKLTLDGVESSPTQPWPRPFLWLLAGAAALGLVALELLSGSRASIVALSTLPLLVAGLLAGHDPALWAETVRATWLPVRWLPVLVPLLVALGIKATHLLGRGLRGWPWTTGAWNLHAVVVATAWLTGTVALLGVLGGVSPGSLAWAAALATLWGVLVWANANAARLRWYNATSLLASALLLPAAEGWLRTTPADQSWDATQHLPGASDMMSSVMMADRDFVSIDQQQHTSYPDRGYPVAIAPPDGRPRLVAMGGSTTGGAWQNDDLNQFYPARLSAYLGPSYQVLNQGVGGWTTWHIRHYLGQGAFEALQPDVMVLYVGHNDLLTPAPRPYAQLYTRWLAGGTLETSSTLLNRFRLYQGLRYTVSGLRPQSQRIAVPVDHARENLEWIIEQVVQRGGRVVLVSEGLAPDPAPMAAYNDMLAALAQASPAVSYIDAADTMHQQPGSRIFLDDCHLTAIGHDLLASLLLTELNERDLLLTPPAALPPAVNTAALPDRPKSHMLGPPVQPNEPPRSGP